MKKILLATSALAAIASFGASAHTRDGLVESSHNRLELAITGEISATMGYTSISETWYDDADADGFEGSGSGFGQSYSADINFTASTHVRNWEIKGVVELDVDSSNFATGEFYELDDEDYDIIVLANDDSDALNVDKVYVDFTAPYGTFRIGKGAGPSDALSLEASLPGYSFEDITGREDGFDNSLFGSSATRFANSYNQIGYYSPNWNGFEFGVAYGFGLDGDNALFQPEYNDFAEVAAKYSGEWNSFSFAVSGAYRGYFGGDSYELAVDPLTGEESVVSSEYDPADEWTAGISIGYMGFDWTTTYGEQIIEDGDNYGIKTALTYEWDRWLVGASYEYGVFGRNSLNEDLADEYSWERVTSTFGVGAEFKVFDGLTWNAALNYRQVDLDVDYKSADFKDYTMLEGDAFQVLTGFDLEW